MRAAALLLLLGALMPGQAAEPQTEYVQAVEFPYYLYPKAQWERELVWLKTIGVSTVEFSIPWNWHQLRPGEYDFNGRTSPRRDLLGFIRILRRLELRGWVRPLPPVRGWIDNGWPGGATDAAGQRTWLKELEGILATQTQKHGGPIQFVEGGSLAIDAASAPAPVTVISALDPAAFTRSRAAITSARGALVWSDVEDLVYPAGWEGGLGPLLHPGAVQLDGEERPATAGLRREAALLRSWSRLFGKLHPVTIPKPPAGRLPRGVTATELTSSAASAVSVINRGSQPFHDDVRVIDPSSRRTVVIPSVTVPPGEALWLPLDVSLGPGGLCRECSGFSAAEHIIYSTAELLSVEFENGILAMEFAAPQAGEVILQLAREPVGPFLAAGKPTKFDWDEKTLRVRLAIPSSKAAGNRVRIGLAIEAPETSAFFSEARRLIIGQKNLISTVYSSPDVAARSRLRAPEGFSATSTQKSPNEIDYEVSVPPDTLHGDWASLALEADGLPLGRARLQLFRPVSIRLTRALDVHFGSRTHLAVDPPTVTAETRAGSEVELVVRNNSPEIKTYRFEASGDGLEFLPARAELSVGPVDERRISFRVFGKDGATGVREAQLRVRGDAESDQPLRILLLPRNGTVAWSEDLDGDGVPEWVLENQRVRAVFSARDGGRWIELTWKDTDTNFLPEEGVFAQPGAVEVRADGNNLVLAGNGWTRSIRLNDSSLSIEQNTALPHDSLKPQALGAIGLGIDRQSENRAVYTLRPIEP